MPTTETERDLNQLESALKRLEVEYNMFFSGRLPRPPLESRTRVAALMKQQDRKHFPNYGDRFRFLTLQSRYAALVDLWDRGLRAREEGRAGPFAQPKSVDPAEAGRPDDRVVHVTGFHDPMHELDKLQDLHASLTEARRAVGADAVPFHRFTELVKSQVERLQAGGSGEVAFRVAVKDGRVNLTARLLKGATQAGRKPDAS